MNGEWHRETGARGQAPPAWAHRAPFSHVRLPHGAGRPPGPLTDPPCGPRSDSQPPESCWLGSPERRCPWLFREQRGASLGVGERLTEQPVCPASPLSGGAGYSVSDAAAGRRLPPQHVHGGRVLSASTRWTVSEFKADSTGRKAWGEGSEPNQESRGLFAASGTASPRAGSPAAARARARPTPRAPRTSWPLAPAAPPAPQ